MNNNLIVEISALKVPMVAWFAQFSGAIPLTLSAFVIQDRTTQKYECYIGMDNDFSKPSFVSQAFSYEQIEKAMEQSLEKMIQKKNDSGQYTAYRTNKIIGKDRTVEEFIQLLGQSGAFTINTKYVPKGQLNLLDTLDQNTESNIQQVQTISKATELEELLKKYNKEQLKTMIEKMNIEKLSLKYGREAVDNFVREINK